MRVEVEDDVLALVEQLPRERHGASVLLGPAELVEAGVVDAEVVRDLVDDGDAHLLDDLGLVRRTMARIGRRKIVMRSGITIPS